MEGDRIGVFVSHNPDFRLPSEDKGILMIGPGTGLAPFMAFIKQRSKHSIITISLFTIYLFLSRNVLLFILGIKSV